MSPAHTHFDVHESMREQLEEICRRYQVADLYAFGSRAAEFSAKLAGKPFATSRAGSDLDIGVRSEGRHSWSAAELVSLTIELEDLFHVPRVDLVVLPEAEPFLALDIIRSELLYTVDPDEQARYELFVLRRAGDLLPFKKERMRMVLKEGAL